MEVTKADIPRINYILSQDDVYEYVIDDNVSRDFRWNLGTILSRTDVIMLMPNSQCILLARELEDEKDCYEVHVAFTRKCRGRNALKATAEAIKYFNETHPDARTLVALIPICNRRAIVYATYVGFKRTGIEYGSFKKDGKNYDQIRLEYNFISKEEE